jgi:lysophospholipase L1-like esterase
MIRDERAQSSQPQEGAKYTVISRRRKIVRASLFPLLLLFVAGEITGRLLERHAGYRPRRLATFAAANPFLRTALVPGIRFSSGTSRVEVNSFGFRGPEFSMPKPAGLFRIFALGESTTFGWKEVASHEQAWPALLEAKLRRAHPGRAIEVINAGVPGYTSIEQRINFMLRISKLEPDAILIYHGNNDLNWSWVPDVKTKLVYGRELPDYNDTWYNRAIDYSYVLMEIRSRIAQFGITQRTKHDDPDPAALAMLHENLRGLVDDARRIGVKVGIATFPHALDEKGAPDRFNSDEHTLGVPLVGRWFDSLSPTGLRRSFPLYNANIRQLAATEKIPLCDLAAVVPPTPEYHSDWCHLTARGHQFVADRWFETIEQGRWLP